MQLLQGQVLQQRARLAICTGLGHQLLHALSQGRALVGLGCLEHLLQHPHALWPRGILHAHPTWLRTALRIATCRALWQTAQFRIATPSSTHD